MKRTKVLIAPSAYKGSLGSSQVGQAIKDGLQQLNRQIDIKCMPLADGGDGTIESIRSAVGGILHSIKVVGPLNNEVEANWLELDNLVVIELANCCGIASIADLPKQPLMAHTYGLGQLISACLSESPKKLLIGLGGSASTDGGTGALAALGMEFLNAKGQPLPLGGGALVNLESINLTGLDKRLAQVEIELLTDVHSPLLGKEGAATIFAPQKGANQEEVSILENGLSRLACLTVSITQTDLSNIPGSGSAGGAAFGLGSFLKAKLCQGFKEIADLIALREKINNADLVITAEGKLDSQSFAGKATGELARLCKNFGKPLIVFAASIEDQIAWEGFGISAAYSTVRINNLSSYEDIIETVRQRMYDCKHF